LLQASLAERDRRTLVVVAFTAEETGMGGSGHYVENPLVPLDATVAMVNLDMVGRVRGDRLQALGSESAEEWPAILEPAAQAVGLKLAHGGDGYGPSDQTPFYAKGVPVVHFFSGAHEQYHTPDDDFPTLDVAGGGNVARLLATVLADLTARPQPLTEPAASCSATCAPGDRRTWPACAAETASWGWRAPRCRTSTT
jgi:Zn-dependent M28 family amino/carboxypeptidase